MKIAFRKIKSYTLVELMIVVVIISVIAGIAVPAYNNTLENSTARTARMTLKLVYYNEKMYRSNIGGYLAIDEGTGSTETARWNDMRLDNPNIVNANSGYQFSVIANGSSFTGKARRTKDGRIYEITPEGAISNPDGQLPPITY